MYKHVEFTIDGIAPLLMHNVRLANPRDPITRAMKAITAKGKKKTDADLDELSRLEFMGGLYVGENGEPVVPGECIEAMVRKAAMKSRKGQDALAGIISDGNWPLIYDGPKTADELWADGRFVDCRGCGVQKSRVIRTRPRFNAWSLKFTVSYLPELINERELIEWVETAGQLVGMLDFRPKFGRFLLRGQKAVKAA